MILKAQEDRDRYQAEVQAKFIDQYGDIPFTNLTTAEQHEFMKGIEKPHKLFSRNIFDREKDWWK